MNSIEFEWNRNLQTWWGQLAHDVPPLCLAGLAIPHLFEVNPHSGVTISTDQAAGISFFAGIPTIQYFRLCALLGLTQWRALNRNAMLVAEDLAHVEPEGCLFVQQPCKSDYALVLERPAICIGCFDFYHCLGADTEVVALAEMIRELQGTTAGSPLLPVLR